MAGMRRAFILALGAAFLSIASTAAPAVAAGTFQGSLTVRSVGVPAKAGESIAVSAEAAVALQCDPGSSCAWLPFVTTVPASAQCSAEVTASTWVGDPFGQAAGRLPQTLAPIWREWPDAFSGPKRACLYARTSDGDVLVAQADYTVPGPIVLPPTANVPRTPIPRSIGARRGYAYRLSTASIPRGVDPARFSLVVRAAARRWGLRLTGRTSRPARSGDRVDAVGFARDVPSYALGVTTIRSVRFFRRVNGRPRLISQRVVERDTRLAVRVPWHAGPGDPPVDRVDLQTVVIHELGHYAGNDHVRNCTDSPMWVALRPGEWWRDRGDWFQFGCGRQRATASASTAPKAPQPPRRLLVERIHRDVFLD